MPMIKRTGWRRLLEFWLKPKQWVMLEAHNGRPAKNIHIRPISLVLIPLISLMAGAFLSYKQPAPQHVSSPPPLLLETQQQLSTAREQLVAAIAENSLKQAQLASLKDILQQQQSNISRLQQKTQVFNSLLQARKGSHIQAIQALLQPISTQSLSFHVTLVKGGNYPRRVKGSMAFIYQDKQGKSHLLRFKNDKETLPYEMETHIFVEGEIHTAGSVPLPEQPRIDFILYNDKGSEIMRKTCELGI